MLRFNENTILLTLKPAKFLLTVFILFFYLYGVNFTFLPVSTARIIVLFAFCYLLLKFFFKPAIPLRRSHLLLLLAFIVLAYWILFISVVNGYSDSAMFTSVTLMLVHSFIGGLFFSLIFYNFGLNFRQVIFLIQAVITIQAVFILIYFVSWEFREFTFTYIPETGNIDYQVNLFQSRGLTHSSGAVLSVLQSLGVLFSAYLLSTAKYRSLEFLYLLLSFGLLCLSIFITGRTGILILPLVFLYFVLIVLSKSGIPKNIAYFSISAPIILIISFIGFKFVFQNILGGISGATGEDIFDRVVRWYVEEFFSKEGFQSRTVNILSGHWFFPDDISGLLFGNPDTWGVNRIRSDIGYVRMWHGIGLVGVLVYYLFFFSVFIQMVLSTKAYTEKVMVGILGFYLFFIEMKEPFMFNVYVNAFFILIFAYIVLSKSHSNKVIETS